jgi:hypothetical protein
MKVEMDRARHLFKIAQFGPPKEGECYFLTFFMVYVNNDEVISADGEKMSWEIYSNTEQIWWVLRCDYAGTLVFDDNISQMVKRLPQNIDTIFDVLEEKEKGEIDGSQALASLDNKQEKANR